jgi:hypothetical protein
MPATYNEKRQKMTFFKISKANFKNGEIQIARDFIAEAIEYTINPFN